MTKSWKKLAGMQLCPGDVMQLLPTEVPTELTPLELLPLLIAKKNWSAGAWGRLEGSGGVMSQLGQVGHLSQFQPGSHSLSSFVFATFF